jgi:hypothetical protein
VNGETGESFPGTESGPARFARATIGVLTIVAGVVAAIETTIALATESVLSSGLEELLPLPMLSRGVLAALGVMGIASGILVLRRKSAGATLCSGVWAAVAALAAHPSIRFNYAEGGLPQVELPDAGSSIVTMVVFALGMILVVLARALPHEGPGAAASPATIGDTAVGIFLLVWGATAALAFRVEADAVGPPAYDRLFLPLLLATLVLEIVGLGVLARWTLARATAATLLLAIALAGVLPDLFFDQLIVEPAMFWSPAFAIAALALLVPHRRAASRDAVPAM